MSETGAKAVNINRVSFGARQLTSNIKIWKAALRTIPEHLFFPKSVMLSARIKPATWLSRINSPTRMVAIGRLLTYSFMDVA